MDNFSYFHLCDHQIRKSQKDGEIATLTVKNGRDLIDIIINGAVVLEIYEVRAIEYDKNDFEIIDFYYDNEDREQTYDDVDPGESYYDEGELYFVEYGKYFLEGEKISRPLPASFYEPYLHNRIRWIVKPPATYQIKAKIRYTRESYENYRPEDCPICGGKGWFIDILNKNGQFEQPVGIIKVAQRVVKDMLTEVGSQLYDLEYGTELKKQALFYTGEDDELFNFIRMIVSEVEDNYLTDQQNMILELPPEETLLALHVDDVYRHPAQPRKVMIRLRIETSTNDEVFKFGF